MGADKIPVVLVRVPFPAQGHINQLLQLSANISAMNNNIPIHFTGSQTLIHQGKSRFVGPALTNINFHEFSIPTSKPTLPSQNSGKLSGLFQPSAEASVHLRQPVADLLATLSATTHRLVLIYDFLSSVTIQDFVLLPNVEAYAFQGISAFMAFTFFYELFGKPNIINEETVEYLPPAESTFGPEFIEHIKETFKLLKLMGGILYDGCRLLEGKYIDLVNSEEMMGPQLKQWALGPFNVVEVTPQEDPNKRHYTLKWLDERVKGQGIITREWAPQIEILAHPSTGGFLSHCGWNSSMESLTMGVPIAAWPMHCDQPRNSILITKGLKVGIMVGDYVPGDKVVTSSTVEKAVKRLMTSPEGEQVRNVTQECDVSNSTQD